MSLLHGQDSPNPDLGTLARKITIYVCGRPTVVAKGSGFDRDLHCRGLGTWIWEALALGVGHLPKATPQKTRPPKAGP